MIFRLLIDTYTLIVFAAVILSWLPLSHDNPVVQFTRTLTEPVLQRIRRVMPPIAGLDLSPMLLLLGLHMLRRLLFF